MKKTKLMLMVISTLFIVVISGCLPGGPTERLVIDQNVIVKESDSNVDTVIDIMQGDRILFSASGSIWAGVALTGTNGPDGWGNYFANDPKFPLQSPDILGQTVHPYSLIGRFGTRYFNIGSGLELSGNQSKKLIVNPTMRLYLRTNDDSPGNGDGEFNVNIKVYRIQ